MSILVMSVSHKTAPIPTLARLALDGPGASKLGHALAAGDHIDEVVVLSTCNRTEIYASVSRFHGGLDDLSQQLAAVSGFGVTELHDACSVFYDEGAVAHMFTVATGLDSMVVGESQILGQVRAALTRSQRDGTVGTVLNALFQQAIRVGKRAQSETGLGAVGRSVVSASIDRLVARIGPLSGLGVVILGAGSMASLAARTVAAEGALVTCVNRTTAKAERLAAKVDGRALPWSDRADALRDADVIISCTGALTTWIHPDDLAGGQVLGVVDLALPADVDPGVAEVTELVNLSSLLDPPTVAGPASHAAAEVAAATALVAVEVHDFLAGRRAAQVAPTVVALRSMASAVTAAELIRLEAKLPGLSERDRAEVAKTVRRVADKLLHRPTVRVQQVDTESGVDYAAALRDLFALDPSAVDAVMNPRVEP